MPRHATAESASAFLEARKPRVIVVQPEPCWVIDNYRVKRWYYRQAPEVGDRVYYLSDGFETRVQSVKFFSLFFADGNAMRRPYTGGRMVAWVLPRLQNLILTNDDSNNSTKRETSFASSMKRRFSRSKLRPDAATLFI